MTNTKAVTSADFRAVGSANLAAALELAYDCRLRGLDVELVRVRKTGLRTWSGVLQVAENDEVADLVFEAFRARFAD